jgi:hypothetical protein
MRPLPTPFYDTIWVTLTLGFNDVRPGMDIGSDGVSRVRVFRFNLSEPDTHHKSEAFELITLLSTLVIYMP